jgi:hypothetical protein
MRALIDLVEAYERKHNPSGTQAGVRAAHRAIGEDVKKLVEEKKLDPMKISFKGLFEQLVAEKDLEENLSSSAFPTIAGEIISSVMIQAYQAFPKAGDRLVRTVPSRLKVSMIAGWKAIGKVAQVNERQPYGQVVPPDEKTITIDNKKYGGLMDLTKESIFFDQTGELIDRARGLGEEGARFRDEIIMNTVCDINGTALGGAALYSGGNDNLITTNPLGTTGWENAHVELLDKKDDNTGKPIWVFGERPIMVVPAGLYPTAWKLQQNEYGPQGTANLDRNMAQNMYDIVVNPYLTKASTDWFYGGFNRQFRWEEVWPLEVFTRVGQDTEEGFNKDIIQQFKVSLFGGCGAVDTRYVLKNQA